LQRDEILERLRERILSFAASRLQREAAEDMAQETLLVLHAKYAHVESLDELLPLAFQIVRFKIGAALRKRTRRGEERAVEVETLALANADPDPESEALHRERRTRLLAALADLGERCRELLRMKLSGRTFDEIRAHFGVASINTVYTWDLRCRRQLIERIRDLWGDRP
jgi:RNA polymerase sigma-70 factor (ECF subfamily)